MNLAYALSTAASLPLMGQSTPDNVTHIDQLLTSAGAALHHVGNAFEDLATSMALGHVCDIEDCAEAITECKDILVNGGDIEVFSQTLADGQIDEEHLAYQLAQNFGPISALDGADEQQANLARQVSVSLRAVYHLAAHVEKLRYNNLDMASNLLFNASQLCRTLRPDLAEEDKAELQASAAA